MMFGWNGTPQKVECKRISNGCKIYEVGRWDVMVHEDGEVQCVARNGHSTDPRQTFENMTIEDGEMRIPISDMVGEVLKRAHPVDLAQALWSNSEVKEAFMDALVHYYNTDLGPHDQTKFLFKIKESIHDNIVYRVRTLLEERERRLMEIAHRMFSVETMNRRMEVIEAELRVRLQEPDFHMPRFMLPTEEGLDLGWSGNVINEARDHWRKVMEERFPGPEEPIPEPPSVLNGDVPY